MKLKFHGAVGGVTGSCYELKDEKLKVHILVDCGMVQGEPDADQRNHGPLPFNPATLTHVILTHAHLDHCGLIPRLYKEGYSGKIYAMNETRDLALHILQDSSRLDVPYKARHIPKKKHWYESPKSAFGHPFPIAKDVFLRFVRAGHIIGAISVTILWGKKDQNQKSIIFSGDVGPNKENQETQPLIGYSMSPLKSDFLVTESTYGNTVRPPASTAERLARLDLELEEALLQKQGVVIMPAFSIQRTPALLCDLTLLFAQKHEKYAGIPVILDGSLALKGMQVAAQAYQRSITSKNGSRSRDMWLGRGFYRDLGLDYRDLEDRQLALDCLKQMLLEDHEPRIERRGLTSHWRRIWERATAEKNQRHHLQGPAIVIAGSGMANAGPVQTYLKRHLRNDSTTVLFAGHCSPDTTGGQLLGLSNLPQVERHKHGGHVDIAREKVPVRAIRAKISKLDGYSAHADQAGLLDWLWSALPGQPIAPIADVIFITHGQDVAREALATAIRNKATQRQEKLEVLCPEKHGPWYELDTALYSDHHRQQEIGRLRKRLAELEAIE